MIFLIWNLSSSLEFHGIPWNFKKKSMEFHGIFWGKIKSSMEFAETRRKHATGYMQQKKYPIISRKISVFNTD